MYPLHMENLEKRIQELESEIRSLTELVVSMALTLSHRDELFPESLGEQVRIAQEALQTHAERQKNHGEQKVADLFERLARALIGQCNEVRELKPIYDRRASMKRKTD